MLPFPEINPIAIALGPLQIRWYALTYIAGFAAAWWLGNKRAARIGSGWDQQQVADLITNGMLGVILGGRIGYVLFYDFADFLNDPVMLFKVWQGGMSFHGGFLGVLIAVTLYARSMGKSMYEVLDFTAPLVPIGLGTGRLGNFINGELWGRVTEVPWAMVFPNAGSLPRHPSQLYQFAGEGVLLFILVWCFSNKPRPTFAVSGMFCLGYGVLRFGVEFFRQPDANLQFVAFNWMTRGQQLSLPMIVAGIVFLALAYQKNYFAPVIRSKKKS